MRAGATKPSSIFVIILGLAALGLGFLPARRGEALRSFIHDATLPGHRLMSQLEEWARQGRVWLAAGDGPTAQDVASRKMLAAAQLRCRQLELERVALRRELDEARRSPEIATVPAGEPLLVPGLVAATVLAGEDVELLRSGLLIDAGRATGLTESAAVLEGTPPLLDQGETSGMAVGQPVCAGRTVIGRVEHVGCWVSRVRGVSDPDYTDFVQLARPTPDGLVFGPRGVLRGMGEGRCRVERIGGAESVSVGDKVYSIPSDPTRSPPLYYGTVIEAEPADGGTQWRIMIEPAANTLDVRTVQVLRKTINPARLMAN